uniref:NR LBD domain-containing protein n=1 Tax=Ditylenchus dipsaci TaxID=166011 RepID=A0A915EFB8_9BILA
MKSSPHSDYVIGSPQSAFTPLFPTTNGLLSPSMSHPVNVLGSSTILSNMSTCSIFPSSSSSPTSYLNKMVEEYFDQRKRRRSMLCTTLEELLTDDCETRLTNPAVLEDFSAIYRVQMILMFEWAEKLEEFQNIDPHDKAKLLRTFSMSYLLLDNIFHTLELNYDDRLVLVNNSYIQPSIIPSFNNLKTIQEQRALALVYGDNCIKIIEDLIRPLVDMNITFGEILLLRLIIFWNPGPIGLAPETCKMIEKGSERALRELHVYFDDNKVPELKNRLGNLLLLLAPLAIHTKHLAELTSYIPDFGTMPEWDSFMNDLLR